MKCIFIKCFNSFLDFSKINSCIDLKKQLYEFEHENILFYAFTFMNYIYLYEFLILKVHMENNSI